MSEESKETQRHEHHHPHRPNPHKHEHTHQQAPPARGFHPTWWWVIGTVLILLCILAWTLAYAT
jgi:ABC-type Zn2+ transport system substrate-binding protein/surface adhesin